MQTAIQKTGTITISASGTESKEYIVFRVADTGDGIDEELLPHVFDKGYSGDGGSGLGLAICREAVEAHGGMLDVERTGPEGNRFCLHSVEKGDGAVSMILLVEDNPHIMKINAEAFEHVRL